jgi:hypothetical protein
MMRASHVGHRTIISIDNTRLISRARDPEREASLLISYDRADAPACRLRPDLRSVDGSASSPLELDGHQVTGGSGQLMVGEPVFHPPPIEPHLLTIVNSVINAAYKAEQ